MATAWKTPENGMHTAYTSCTQPVCTAGHGSALVATATAAIASAVLIFSAPAAAGEFTPPEGCEGWLTVQTQGCSVNNYYRCAADAPGEYWFARIEADGLHSTMRIGAGYQWLETRFATSGRVYYTTEIEDPGDVAELLSSGEDLKAFSQVTSDGFGIQATGRQWLTGGKTVIDGVPLLETAFEFVQVWEDGKSSRMSGLEYVHEDWQMLIAGRTDFLGRSGTMRRINHKPVDFIQPSEPGFFADTPLYGCGIELSWGRQEMTEDGFYA